MEQESKKSLKAPLIFLGAVILAIVVAVVMAKAKGCPPIPVPAGEPAPQPTPPVTAPAKVEEVKKVEVQPVDAGSTGPVIDRPEAGLRVGHL